VSSAVPEAAAGTAPPTPRPAAAEDLPGPAGKPRWRGRLHRAAFFTALGLAPGLVAAAGSVTARLAVGVYALCLLGLFGISALFHCVDWGPGAHARMRRLDHSMIFVFIAGTYTPIAVLTIDSPARELLLGAVWAAAVAGVAVQVLWIDAPRRLTAGLYVAVGWIAVLAVPAMVRGLGAAGVALLVAGGVTYTAGAVVYARQRPDPVPEVFGFHEVFHALVILAACLHLVVVAFIALPRGVT
jgi:hemolysin III